MSEKGGTLKLRRRSAGTPVIIHGSRVSARYSRTRLRRPMSRTIALLFAALLPCAGASLDPGRDLIAWWPDCRPILRSPAARDRCQCADRSGPAGRCSSGSSHSLPRRRHARHRRNSSRALPGVWSSASKARDLGFSSAAISPAGDDKSLQDSIRKSKWVRFARLSQTRAGFVAGGAGTRGVKSGTWPGIHPLDTDVATASGGVWVDANSSLVAYLRGVFPDRPAILGYRPDEDAGVSANRAVPYDSVEIALADAFAAGGNVILSFPNDYRLALLRGEPQALAAWKSLGGLAALAKQHRDAVRTEPWSRTAVDRRRPRTVGRGSQPRLPPQPLRAGPAPGPPPGADSRTN